MKTLLSVIHALCLTLCLFVCGADPASADELFFVDGCRIFSTWDLNAPIEAEVEESFRVREPETCGVPWYASGVMLSVTAAGQFGPGNLEVHPVGSSSQIRRLYYGYLETVVNEMLVRLPIPWIAGDEITIVAHASDVQVAVDIVGYTTEPRPTFPKIIGTIVDIPFQEDGLWRVKVETVAANECTDDETCFDLECSEVAGVADICAGLAANPVPDVCVEVQGYQRPPLPTEPSIRLVATVLHGCN